MEEASGKPRSVQFISVLLVVLLMLALPPLVVAVLPTLPLSLAGLYLILWGTLLPALLLGGSLSHSQRDGHGPMAVIALGLPLILGLLLGLLAGAIEGWWNPNAAAIPAILAHLMLGALWAVAVFFLIQQRWIEIRPGLIRRRGFDPD